MKNIMRKVAVLLSACLFISPAINVNAQSAQVSATGTAEEDLNTHRFDGKVDTDTNANSGGSVNIDVSARVSGGSEIVYDLVISYGAMKFEYDYGSTWNPSTHSYTTGKSGIQGGGWVTADHVDGENNRISIQNNSNFPMKVSLAYNQTTDLSENNTNQDRKVKGVFASTNAVISNAGILARTTNDPGVTDTIDVSLEMCVDSIPVGTQYYRKANSVPTASDYTKSVYFTLIGKPDNGGPTSFESIGQITLTVAPETGVSTTNK